jgi:hypothetical protein
MCPHPQVKHNLLTVLYRTAQYTDVISDLHREIELLKSKIEKQQKEKAKPSVLDVQGGAEPACGLLPATGPCHPPRGSVTLPGALSPSLGICHPPRGPVTLPGALSPSPEPCHPPRGPVTLPRALSPSPGLCHPPRGPVTFPRALSPFPGSCHLPRGSVVSVPVLCVHCSFWLGCCTGSGPL